MGERTLISFDWAIKRLLRQKANFGILEGFLSELLHQDIVIKSILDPEGNQKDRDDKYNKVDLLCEDSLKQLIIIEVQFYEETDYFHRMLYSSSKAISEYIKLRSPYSKVRKVYSVNILYFDLGHGKDYLYIGRNEFRGIYKDDVLYLSEKQRRNFNKENPADIFPEYYLIKVNNFDNIAKNTLDEWIYFLKNTALPEGYKAKGLDKVEQQLNPHYALENLLRLKMASK